MSGIFESTFYINAAYEAYERAPIVVPPTKLDPIFVTEKHNFESLKNLAISYAMLSPFTKIKDETTYQLFEVPPIDADCFAYSNLGYMDINTFQSKIRYNPFYFKDWYPDISNGWIELPNSKDFTCHEGFEKVFIYEKAHATRQWGDGTVLGKHGKTREHGASAVFRCISPEIYKGYGPVIEVWIRPYVKEEIFLQTWQQHISLVPAPSFRWQSTYQLGQVPFAKSFATCEEAKTYSPNWQHYFQWGLLRQQLIHDKILPPSCSRVILRANAPALNASQLNF